MTWTIREVIPRFPGMLAGGTTRLLLEQIPANVRSILLLIIHGPTLVCGAS